MEEHLTPVRATFYVDVIAYGEVHDVVAGPGGHGLRRAVWQDVVHVELLGRCVRPARS